MRIRNARIVGFGPFKDVSIDFDALPPEAKLVALCGENGEGKSTLVDLLVDGANWRDWPRRAGSTIAHVATGRDSLLEVETEVGGRSYRMRHLVDGTSGKGESAAYCGAEALTKSGKLTEFYAWAKEALPAKSVVHSSIVSHPAYGSFVTMKATERKDVILLALGVDGIEKLARDARGKAVAAEAQVRQLRGELVKAEESAGVEAATKELAIREQVLHNAGWLLSEAQAELDVARQLAGDSALARQRHEEQTKARQALLDRQLNTARELGVAVEALSRNDVDEAEEELRVAKRDEADALAAVTTAEALVHSLRAKRDAAQRQTEDRYRVQLELDRATAAKADIVKRVTNIRGVMAKKEEIRAVIQSREENAQALPGMNDAEDRAKREAADAEANKDAVLGERLSGAEDRIEQLRTGLGSVANDAVDEKEDLRAIAVEAIHRDDATILAAAQYPQRVSLALKAVSDKRDALRKIEALRRQVSEHASATHPQEAALTAAEGLLSERETQLASATAEVERLTEELEALPEPEAVPADPAVGTMRVASSRAASEAVAAAERVASVKATRAQLEPQVERLRADVEALGAQLEATPEPVAPESSPELGALERELQLRRDEQTRAAQGVGATKAKLDAANAANERAGVLRGEVAAAEQELADWTRLGSDLGRKGLQAALVDSAGPELTRATNDLLHSCFGTRWTVTFETQRIKGDGELAESYEIRIIDTERGRDGVVEDLSDGERTIVGEAVSLALSELACKRAGFERPTLIRDESGAALSAERRPMWVAMLRRAAQHVNADRVILISHSEDVQDLCDARMRVAGGKVTVEA